MKKPLIRLAWAALGVLILIISGICVGWSVNLIAVYVFMVLVIFGLIFVLLGRL